MKNSTNTKTARIGNLASTGMMGDLAVIVSDVDLVIADLGPLFSEFVTVETDDDGSYLIVRECDGWELGQILTGHGWIVEVVS
jgi:hypothetical protein